MRIGNIHTYYSPNKQQNTNNKLNACTFGQVKVNVKEVSPTIKLISDTKDIVDKLYVACKNCVSPDTPYEIYCNLANVSQEEKLRVIRNAVKSGHTSILEHAGVTFAISDISRVCAQMLKSYRQSSTTQKSQRYVAAKEQFDYIIPGSINKHELFKEKYINLMKQISDLYLEFVQGGIPPEDARYAYSLAVTSATVTTFNLRELILVENERLCTRAQEEIRILMNKIRNEVINKEPWLKEFLVPKCVKDNFCIEHKSCGKMPHKPVS